MELNKFTHLIYCPFTGLGLYGGFRGNRWLRNRIKVFDQFVLSSLLNQTIRDFTLWISWRPEEKNNKYVQEFVGFLDSIEDLQVVHTFNGLCFYDDKFEDREARQRLSKNLHGSLQKLVNVIGDCDYVLMTIQPSDDLYHRETVESLQRAFQEHSDVQAMGFQKGYICNYRTKQLAEYNPDTNPPFYTIKFPKADFIDPVPHIKYTSLKNDIGKYKKGVPIPSHEYVEHALNYKKIEERGFIVGTHGENISTYFDHPYKGREIIGQERENVFIDFGIQDVSLLNLPISLRKKILQRLPYPMQKKIRYWFGEKLWNRFYEFSRS